MSHNVAFVHDLLCSWCYGFQPVMRRIIKEYEADVTFDFVSCGLFIGRKARPIKNNFPPEADFHEMYGKVIETSGADVRPAYLDGLLGAQNYVADSGITARGFHAFQDEAGYDPSRWMDYHEAFQGRMFKNGTDPNSDEIYRAVAEDLGLPSGALLETMGQQQYADAAEHDFVRTREEFHNRRLPSLYIAQSDGSWKNIISGYHTGSDTLRKFSAALLQ